MPKLPTSTSSTTPIRVTTTSDRMVVADTILTTDISQPSGMGPLGSNVDDVSVDDQIDETTLVNQEPIQVLIGDRISTDLSTDLPGTIKKSQMEIDDATSGHGSWRPSIAQTGSEDVIVNG